MRGGQSYRVTFKHLDVDNLRLLRYAVRLAGDGGRNVGAVAGRIRVRAVGRGRPSDTIDSKAGPALELLVRQPDASVKHVRRRALTGSLVIDVLGRASLEMREIPQAPDAVRLRRQGALRHDGRRALGLIDTDDLVALDGEDLVELRDGVEGGVVEAAAVGVEVADLERLLQGAGGPVAAPEEAAHGVVVRGDGVRGRAGLELDYVLALDEGWVITAGEAVRRRQGGHDGAQEAKQGVSVHVGRSVGRRGRGLRHPSSKTDLTGLAIYIGSVMSP